MPTNHLSPTGETTYSDLSGDTVRWLPDSGLLLMASSRGADPSGVAVALSPDAAKAFGLALLRYASRSTAAA